MKTNRSGFSLIEVVLALGVASFCLLTLVGLIPVGVQSHQSSNEETRMANIAAMIIQDLTSAPTSATTSPYFGFTIPAAGQAANTTTPQTVYLEPTGSLSGTVGAAAATSSLYRVSIAFIPPAGGQRTATMARVMVTWPARADATPSQWPSHYSGIFQTVVALNRN